MKSVLLGLALLIACPALEAQKLGGGPGQAKRLNKPYMSTTNDLGASFIPFRSPGRSSSPITWGLAALDDTGTLVMHADNALWGSLNDGKRWTKIADEVSGLFRIVAGPNGHAYAWQDNGGAIYQIVVGDSANSRWTVSFRKGLVTSMHGFVVDPLNPLHVRTAGNPGQIHESFDGGLRWSAVGVPAVPGGFLGYVTAFDPNNLDHAVYGRVTDGGFVTFNGGNSWAQSTGLTAVPGSNMNLFNAVVSPSDGNTVFAAGIDFSDGTRRHIYASTDGGLSFAAVLTDNVGGVMLQNSPTMEADATNSNLLRFIFSASPIFGGTTFYEYDLGTRVLNSVQNLSIPKVREIESSRRFPGSLHVGFDFN